MINFIHDKKIIAGLALGVAAVAVGSLWLNDDQESSSGMDESRSSRRSAGSYRDGDSTTITRRAARRASAPASRAPGADAPRSIQRSKGADRNIIARGSGEKSTVQNKKRSSRAGNARARRGPSRLTLSLGDSSLSARQRVANLESLANSSLSEAELEDAYNFLATTPDIAGISASSKHWIVDELITALRVNGADNQELTSRLAEVFQNNDDMVVRDYALQHLGHLRSEGGDIAVIDSSLAAATSEKSGTLAGTAILVLNAQSNNDTSLTTTTQQQAMTIVNDTGYDVRARISALQVAGQQGNAEILTTAIKIASSDAQPVPLRMAAIATLANLQAKDQQGMLETLKNSQDTRLQSAATAAVNKLTAQAE